MILRISKGKLNWNHPINIFRDLLVEKELNFFYWLGKHLKERNIDLE